jgi:protein subunit release factor B
MSSILLKMMIGEIGVMDKQKLLSVTIKDCEVQTFCSGGPGGQNQNKRKSGVRIIHRDSGARGESREHKSQDQNKRAAFRRMAETREFSVWLKLQSSRLSGKPSIEEIVNQSLEESNLKIEKKDDTGQWITWSNDTSDIE